MDASKRNITEQVEDYGRGAANLEPLPPVVRIVQAIVNRPRNRF